MCCREAVGRRVRLREVRPGDPCHRQALNLRYSLFFEPLGLPRRALDDAHEISSRHLCLVMAGQVVAYVRWHPEGGSEIRITQMVVASSQQRAGLGSRLLHHLLSQAWRAGARRVVLAARRVAVPFYRRHGFTEYGPVFASAKTGLPHITMMRRLP